MPYHFRPVTDADIPLLRDWRARPHVQQWWGAPELEDPADVLAEDAVAMWIVVLFAAAWVVVAGLTHFEWNRVMDFPPGAFRLNAGFFAGLGGATLIAMYDYGGYFNVSLGDTWAFLDPR